MMSQVYGGDRYDWASTWHKNCHFCCAQSAACFHGSFLQKPLLFIADRSLLSCAFISALPAFNTLYKPIFLPLYLLMQPISLPLPVCLPWNPIFFSWTKSPRSSIVNSSTWANLSFSVCILLIHLTHHHHLSTHQFEMFSPPSPPLLTDSPPSPPPSARTLQVCVCFLIALIRLVMLYFERTRSSGSRLTEPKKSLWCSSSSSQHLLLPTTA